MTGLLPQASRTRRRWKNELNSKWPAMHTPLSRPYTSLAAELAAIAASLAQPIVNQQLADSPPAAS